jgi:uncharacterized protein YndB with AHSA1/START domain
VTEPLRLAFDVACSREHAFLVWTTKLSHWWPSSHTVTGSSTAEIVLEPTVGGRIYERGPDGTEHDWGELTTWDPPARFGYRWHLRQDRADASQVDIAFIDEGDRTRVEIEHSGWDRLGAKGAHLRERNQAGWAGLPPHYVAACGGT